MSSLKDYILEDEEFKKLTEEVGKVEYREIPKGTYRLRIVESKALKPDFGDGVNFKVEIMDGEMKGTKFYTAIYLQGENELAVKIAKHNFNTLVKIKGYFSRAEDLNNLDFIAYVSSWKNQAGKIKYNLSVKKQSDVTTDNCPAATIAQEDAAADEDIPF
jgi:hypothetical protein